MSAPFEASTRSEPRRRSRRRSGFRRDSRAVLRRHDFQTGDEVEDRLTRVQDLDWQGFLSAYFPGSGRHDLRAITAYAAYKRSRVVDEQSATEAGRLKGAERTSLKPHQSKLGKTRAARRSSGGSSERTVVRFGGALRATRPGRIVVALGRDLRGRSVRAAHSVVHRVPVTRDLSQGTGRGQSGFLKSRVHSLDLGHALLEGAPLFRELAQFLSDYLVVVHSGMIPQPVQFGNVRGRKAR